MLSGTELVWLLAATAKGDAAAFERLYLATRPKLYGVAIRILRRNELAEEIMQEAYVKIWRNAGEFNPRLASPLTWMVAILRNSALDLLRKKTDASIEDEPAAVETLAHFEDPLAARETSDELRRLLACMGSLEEEHRRVLLLAYYNGWSRDQLAAKFDKPVNTIKTWLRRSLTQLRECLDR